MAVDPDEVVEEALASPKSATNAAGESVEARSADEIATLLDRANRAPRKPPFAVTRGIPPGATGPGSRTE